MSDKPNGTATRQLVCEHDRLGRTCEQCDDAEALEAEREHRLRETARADRERTLRLDAERRLEAVPRDVLEAAEATAYAESEATMWRAAAATATARAEAAELELGRLRAQLATLRKGAGE
jgi:hypothetical protein